MQRFRKLRGWKNLGLFPRLVAAFVVVGIGSVAASSGAVYLSARDVLQRDDQNNKLAIFKRATDSYFGDGEDFHANDPVILNKALDFLGARSRVEVVDGSHSGGDLPAEKVPEPLRDIVAWSDGIHFQRVWEGATPVFYIGRRIPIDDASNWTGAGLLVFIAYPSDSAATLAVTRLGIALLIALLAAATGTFIAARLVRPLRQVTNAIDQMQDRPKHVPIPVAGWGEISTLTRKLNETSEQLDLSMSDLRESEAGARRFVADVSHELRTPVAALVALTEVLPAGPGHLSEPQARAVDITKNEVSKLARLVDDLIEISRFDAGRAQTRSTVESLSALTAQGIASRGWDVELDLDETIETAIDARRWDLIIANLVSNAFRHGEPPVNVSLAADGTGFILTVTNHGDPIPAGALPHIFERFYKAEHARTRSEGSGLGLAITAENVKLLGGTIKIESDAAATRFTVALPYGDARAAPDEPDEPGIVAVSGHGRIDVIR